LTQKLWYLYLIECVDGSIYTGIAVDVAARYAAHQKGTGARYTRSHPPARLLGFKVFPDRSSASKAEYRIKQLSAPEKRHFAAQCLSPHPDTQTTESVIDKVT
jgi:putative endonuclease